MVSSLNVVGGAAVGETVAASQESQMDALRAILTELHSQDVIQLVSEINLGGRIRPVDDDGQRL